MAGSSSEGRTSRTRSVGTKITEEEYARLEVSAAVSGVLGRWTGADPINLTWDRLGNPSNTLNKYVYAANNPLKYTDSDGMDITLFYRESANVSSEDFGHAFIAAYDPQSQAVDFLDYFPQTDAAGATMLQPQELEMVGPGAVNTGDFSERRGGYASLTIQTTPEVTQKVMEFIRGFKAHPPTYRFPSNTCVTACRAALEIAGIRISAYSPGGLWRGLVQRYSSSYRLLVSDGKSFLPPIIAQHRVDAGSPRNGDAFGFQRFLFNLWLKQNEEERRKKDYEVDIRINYR